jgi:hypothetical protein
LPWQNRKVIFNTKIKNEFIFFCLFAKNITMKNQILVACLITILFSCNEKKQTKNLEITGNIKDLKAGTLILRRIVDTNFVSLDTIKIDGDSHFKIDIDIKEPEMLYLTLNRGATNSMDNNLLFFAEPGKINIETELEYYFAKAKITGSQNQKLYLEYQKIAKKFNEDQLALTELKFLSMKVKNQKKFDSIQNVQDNILRRKYLYAVNFVINNKDHEVAPYVALTEISNVGLRFMDTIEKSLPPKILNSLYGKKLQQLIAQRRVTEK